MVVFRRGKEICMLNKNGEPDAMKVASPVRRGVHVPTIRKIGWPEPTLLLGTLLWSTALNNFKNSGQGDFITLLALTLMLVFSVILTPLVVRNLISGSLSNIASQTAGLAALGLSAGFLSPGAIAGLTSTGTKKAGAATIKGAAWAGSKTYSGAKSGLKFSSQQFKKRFVAKNENPTENEKKE